MDLEQALSEGERGLLERLLDYGERAGAPGTEGELFLVVPRPGTISPWASKATDIAHNCGLSGLRRIERGIAYRLALGAPLAQAGRAGTPRGRGFRSVSASYGGGVRAREGRHDTR
jgi:phosphoribosylformylglycinamidine synthase